MGVSRGYGSLLASGGFLAFTISAFAVSALPPASLAGAAWIFAIPFVAFGAYAGKIADRCDRARVLRVTMALGAVAMLISIPVFRTGGISWKLLVTFVLGAQLTFFSPAKYALLAGEERVARANGIVLSTGLAGIVAGIACGSYLGERWSGHPSRIGLVLAGTAVAGWLCSLKVPDSPPNPGTPQSTARAIVGISWAWFVLPFYFSQKWALTAGFAAGSLAAGALSGDYIESGLVAPGLILLGAASLAMGRAPGHPLIFTALAGCGAGLFVVPLNAALQLKAGGGGRGMALAKNNAANIIALAAAFSVIHTLRGRDILPVAGAATLCCSLYLLARMRIAIFRFFLWSAAHLLFRLRVEGMENIPRTGCALLASNHISYADAVLVGILARWRTIHFLIWQPIFDIPVANSFFRMLEAIPIDAASPKATVRALRAAREELRKGELAGIFPEGSITRTGEIGPFERGFEKLRESGDVPIVPVRIEGLWGHPLSYAGGAPFKSWRKLWRPIVTIRAGVPIRGPVTPGELRDAVLHV